jgi:hypothetical protein
MIMIPQPPFVSSALETVLTPLLNALAQFYESNELERASQHVREVITVSRSQQLVAYEVHASLLLARVQQAQGQVFVAQQHLTALLDKLPVSLPHLAQEIQTAQARLALSVSSMPGNR